MNMLDFLLLFMVLCFTGTCFVTWLWYCTSCLLDEVEQATTPQTYFHYEGDKS